MAANAYITANIISTFNSTQIGNDHERHKIEKLFGGRGYPTGLSRIRRLTYSEIHRLEIPAILL